MFKKQIIVSAGIFSMMLIPALLSAAERIDRRAMVARHAIDTDSLQLAVPLGNGNFCFNTDGTGLQTFTGSTLSHWGWFSEALPQGVTADRIPATGTFQQGRNKGADNFPEGTENIRTWLIENPRRMNLGRIRLLHADGSEIAPEQVQNIRHTVDLWTGISRAEFTLDGIALTVETAVADSDTAVFKISSSRSLDKIAVGIDFPYPSTADSLPWVGDFTDSDRHQTETVEAGEMIRLVHRFGASASEMSDYSVLIQKNAETAFRAGGNNRFLLSTDFTSLEAAVTFAPIGTETAPLPAPLAETAEAQSAARWEKFWLSGGAVDLSQSEDSRWEELERRIVLSQYQLKISDSGDYPASEVGLLGLDCWCGRFHMEMTWWHLAHWFLWGRAGEAEKALDCFRQFLPGAEQLAAQLGYRGAQWQKSVGPNGCTAPWTGNQVLLWKEPHPIFFAELDYRQNPTPETLEKWSGLIEKTAEFMADYPEQDDGGVYHLNPVMPPSELGITHDTTYDLLYWRLGLTWANRWRERMGVKPNADWEKIADHLALPNIDAADLYCRAPADADSRLESHWEHPDLIGAFGNFPAFDCVDPDRARRTVEYVVENWEWENCWGWDFPWGAMASARVGRPDLAVEMLLNDSPRNAYDGRGVNLGGPCPYLPGNGGLLYAVAMMCAGWDGGPDRAELDAPADEVRETAPGFPKTWRVRWEGLVPAP